MLIWTEVQSQTINENVPGKVSFISSQNVYVKFKSTAGIAAGDTLFISSGSVMKPVLVVSSLSSTSCVCLPISAEYLSIDHLILAKTKVQNNKKEAPIIENVLPDTSKASSYSDSVIIQSVPSDFIQKVKGSISLNSYSDFSNTTADNIQRFRYTLSLDARNLADSRFSVESYMSFKHKAGDWENVKSNLNNALKIYSISIGYDINKYTRISLGRKINQRISSIGAIDGFQFETSLKNLTLGAILGSRPDYVNYGFNSKLFQYGAYLSYNTHNVNRYSESSIAFMQQMNQSYTDRRFLYFQHSNSLVKNLNFFGTFEIDLYKLENDLPVNTFSLTGLYVSLRYRLMKSLTIMGSYDARKNVVYYESYKTFIDRVLEDEMRQSLRLQANFRITNDIMFGIQSGYRLLKSDQQPSRNFNSYLTYSNIPGLNMSATLSVTLLETSYLDGKIMGINLTRDLFKGKVQTGISYRYVDYRMPENLLNSIQNIAGIDLSWQLAGKTSLSANYEGTFEKQDKYNRIYFQVRIRF